MNRRTRQQHQQQPAVLGTRHGAAAKHKPIVSVRLLLMILVGTVGTLYALLVYGVFATRAAGSLSNGSVKLENPAQLNQQRIAMKEKAAGVPPDNNIINNNKNNNSNIQANGQQYPYWKDLVMILAAMPAKDALKELETNDPFAVRKFEKDLLEQETALGRLLEPDEIQRLFPCPDASHRITLPDQRMLQKARDFRDAKPGTFLFFQHLRKAGGTHFCSLAEVNLPKKNLPNYYCMPDMDWSGRTKAGYLHSWSNEEIIQRVAAQQHRIAGNEWDWFDVDHHFDLPAVFATSFRKPLDRALSQFRFECIEDRGCKH
jgi:hypothetical protein